MPKEEFLTTIFLTDNEPFWEATRDSPGVNFVAYDQNGLTGPYLSRLQQVNLIKGLEAALSLNRMRNLSLGFSTQLSEKDQALTLTV